MSLSYLLLLLILVLVGIYSNVGLLAGVDVMFLKLYVLSLGAFEFI
jgi:hypothetical protein